VLAVLSVLVLAWIAFGPWHRAAANLRGEDLSTKPSTWTAGETDISQVTGASLVGAKLSGANMHNAFLVNANLSYADLRNAKLAGADLRGANLRQAANWLLAHYGQTALTALGLPLQHDDQLTKNDFQRYQLYPSGEPVGILNFHHAALNDANFDKVDLTSADFTAADLTGASLKECHLEHAKFLNATLGHSDLSGAKLDQATGLTASQLKDAIMCKDTTLPNRLQKLASQEACK
jgi:uncharacterized protein YjbI with pentapeptide repeats